MVWTTLPRTRGNLPRPAEIIRKEGMEHTPVPCPPDAGIHQEFCPEQPVPGGERNR
ncbi:hypothetical protein STXM2123_254 [Streptomyces sp. F-3]|nr:hypothetical protein STXM2123_254 [Streptomyces sp. F-3]